MCEYFCEIETETKFVILMHPKEFKKVKNNTGHFTHQSLKNSELFIGIDFTHNRRINEIIATHESYILFPSPHALNLTQKNPKKSNRPLAIFLIDSTWSCTKSIFYHSKNLQNLGHMSFTTTKKSQYQIKEQPDAAYLSTMESTLVVLEALNQHGVEYIKKESLELFLEPFYKMIAYQQALIANPKSNAVRFKRYKELNFNHL
ncbi:DTW domain-containing protein [Sulfurimonas sp. NWX79]